MCPFSPTSLHLTPSSVNNPPQIAPVWGIGNNLSSIYSNASSTCCALTTPVIYIACGQVSGTWHMQWRGPETLKFDLGGSNRESSFHLVSIFFYFAF